jgi:hypothetical protein
MSLEGKEITKETNEKVENPYSLIGVSRNGKQTWPGFKRTFPFSKWLL